MSDRRRFYLTTAIAYANNAPGLHTVYEVIGADVIARWHRMQGDDTKFLTGTDEHSVNIAQSAAAQGKTPREFVDEKVELFHSAEDELLISPDRFIRTTDPDHYRSAQEMVRRAYANGDIYLDTYEGWYCPNEGFKAPSDLYETAKGMQCPNHPDVALQYLTERNWFFRLSAYQQRLLDWYEAHPDFVQPDYRRNEMLGFIRQGLQDFSISRAGGSGASWGIPFPIGEDGQTAQREDGTWDPEAGTIYVWYDALINYITGAGFPDDMASFKQWWPADLHVIGKDIARFHTIFWPAMLWSAGLEAPEHVWVHGWLLVAGERMSKSRGNFLDPHAVVTAFGPDAARYVTLAEVAFDKDTDVSWDSFVRRYNADLANDFGNLVNRIVSMVNRYLGGERPEPQPADVAPPAATWARVLDTYRAKLDGYLLHDALSALWDFVGTANKAVDETQPWALAKLAKAGDAEAEAKLRRVLGDLVEACRLIGLAAAPFMPGMAPRVLEQLGYPYEYAPDGNGGPALLDRLAWAGQAGPGRVTPTPTPLFPRAETEAAAEEPRMTDRSFIEANRAATAEIRALAASLTEAELSTDLGEGWTVSMALAHLAFWDEWHVARWVYAADQGQLAPPAADGEVTNRANEALVTTWRALSPKAAVELMLNAAEAADEYTADLADEALDAAIEKGGSRWFERSPHRQDHIGQISRALGRG